MIRVKRIYEPADASDGLRVLVDRVWPRGLSKARATIDEWRKEVAPSSELRKWFGHDPRRWAAFKKRYFAELDAHPQGWRPLVEAARGEDVTLLFAAKDEQRNNAVALKEYLERKLGQRGAARSTGGRGTAQGRRTAGRRSGSAASSRGRAR